MKSEGKPESLSQERFGLFAESYVASQTHAKGYDLDRLIEIANPQSDWLMLDVATGGGHTALKFAPHVRRVIATDITPQMLSAAEKFTIGLGVSNITFEPADAQDLPFEDRSFDLVTCRIAPHHFSDCARFVWEGSRVLKPGGMLLVQDHVLPDDEVVARFIDDFERLRDPSHNRAFSLSAWKQMFEQAGLNVTHTQEITKRHQLLPWAERQGCTPEVVEQLRQILLNPSPDVGGWLQVKDPGTDIASFVNHHLLIAGDTPVNPI